MERRLRKMGSFKRTEDVIPKEDKAYICEGSCRGTVTHLQQCGDKRCNLFGEPLQQVSVIYTCEKGSCTESTSPGFHHNDCSLTGRCLLSQALVPRRKQFPLLDPTEENRTYSSIFNDDSIGTGHARSSIASKQAWSAKINDKDQWIIIDAGYVVDSIAGVALMKRRGNGQCVTQVKIDIAVESGNWKSTASDDCYETNFNQSDSDEYITALYLPSSLPVRFVRIRPQNWQTHISLRCGLILAGKAREKFKNSIGDNNEYRPIVDVNQLPACIPLTYIPGGTHPPPTAERPLNSFGVIAIPTGQCEWAGRKMNWKVLEFNGNSNLKRQQRVFAVTSGTNCSIKVEYRTIWNYNRNDYCPGCVVQLYYGLDSVFSKGVIERGISNQSGESHSHFKAPILPGLYYITQSVSLMYHFVTVNHPNRSENSIAVIRVLPFKFQESNYVVLPKVCQNEILLLLGFWMRSGESATIFSALPRETLYMIFTHLIPARASSSL